MGSWTEVSLTCQSLFHHSSSFPPSVELNWLKTLLCGLRCLLCSPASDLAPPCRYHVSLPHSYRSQWETPRFDLLSADRRPQQRHQHYPPPSFADRHGELRHWSVAPCEMQKYLQPDKVALIAPDATTYPHRATRHAAPPLHLSHALHLFPSEGGGLLLPPPLPRLFPTRVRADRIPDITLTQIRRRRRTGAFSLQMRGSVRDSWTYM